MSAPGDGRVLIYRQPDGRWRWSWRDGTVGDALVANETYDDPDEAHQSAVEAYPGAVVTYPADENPERHHRRSRGARLLLLAAGAFAAGHWLGRRQRRTRRAGG